MKNKKNILENLESHGDESFRCAEKSYFSRIHGTEAGNRLNFFPAVRKGQFFIISAVIIASLLLIISHYFSGFGAISLTESSEMSELGYIGMIKKSLNDTAFISSCGALDEEISSTENFFSRKLAEQGIQMTAAHTIASCGSVRFGFNLSSSGFFSSTEFNYP
ncbi:MAG: hypothetical protein WA139_05335 [Candidatus Aenigmatarchaeota archaeon]